MAQNSPRRFSRADSAAVYALAERDSRLGASVKDALAIIDSAVARYGLKHLSLSFNGGKDCTVLIHLLAASVARHLAASPDPTGSPATRIESVYIRCSSPFPQVESFVELCKERYALDLDAVEGGMKEGLASYIGSKRRTDGAPGIEAILVGTRRGDPHGALLTPFDPTDSDWPRFMRVHPILDWSYKDIWDFLRHPELTLGDTKGIDWCEMYNYGYTSLGSTYNTFPNPLLKDDSGALGGWRPAWELLDETKERAGREKPAAVPEPSTEAVGGASIDSPLRGKDEL